MREFLTESVLPFFAVCGLIGGLTVTLFDVPRDPPPPPLSAVTSKAGPLPAPVVAREQMNDVLARAMRQLDAARTPRPAERSASAGSVAPSSGPPGTGAAVAPGLVERPAAEKATTDPGLIQTLSALGEAVKAVHAVRTEEDIVKAEESIRSAREQMEEACKAGGSGGPLCEGASQMRSLGY